MSPSTRSKGGVEVDKYMPKHPLANDEYYRLLAFVQWSIDKKLRFEHDVFPNINSTLYPTYKQVKCKLRREWNLRYAHTYGGYFIYFEKYGLDALELSPDELAKVDSFYNDIQSQRIKDTPSSTDKTIEAAAGIPQPTAIKPSPDIVIPQRPSTKTETDSKVRLGLRNKKARPKSETLKLKKKNTHVKNTRRRTKKFDPENENVPPKSNILDFGSETVRLKTINFNLENENARLKHEMEGLRRMCSKPLDLEVMHTLQNQVELGHRFSKREKKFDHEGAGMSADNISQRFHAVFQRIQETCSHIVRARNIEFQSDVEASDVIDSWSRKTFNSELNAWRQTPNGGSMTTENLLVGVVAAAVIDLAFQPAFPDILSEQSTITNLYRKFILHNGGPKSLQKADFSMFPLLIRDRDGEIVDKGAREIAYRIVQGLQHFRAPQHQRPEDWTQNEEQVMNGPFETSDFMPMLNKALELKVALIASMSRLRFMYFKPDEPFQDTYMARCIGSDHNTSAIKACVFPALFLEPRRDEKRGSKDYFLQYNTEYNTYFTELVDEIPSSSALVAEAMVLT